MRTIVSIFNTCIKRRLDDLRKDILLAQHVNQSRFSCCLNNGLKEDSLAIRQEVAVGQRIVFTKVTGRCVNSGSNNFEIDTMTHKVWMTPWRSIQLAIRPGIT